MLSELNVDFVRVLIFLTILIAGGSIAQDKFIVSVYNLVSDIGSDATLRCSINLNTTTGLKEQKDPLGIIWKFAPVGSNVSVVLMLAEENQTSPKFPLATRNDVKYVRAEWHDLTVLSVQSEDAGTYTCLLDKVNISSSAEMFVIDSTPICTKSDLSTIFYEGDNVTFTCSLSYHGNHPPDLNWELPKLHVDYQQLTFTKEITNTKASSSINFHLQHMIDGKLFTCSAKFANVSRMLSCHQMFPPGSVQYIPFITNLKTFPLTEDHNHRVEKGSNLSLYCTAHGNPVPQWTWTFVNTQGVMNNLNCSMVCILHDIQPKDMGTYTCSVSNVVKDHKHMATESIYIIIDEKPLRPAGVVFKYNNSLPVWQQPSTNGTHVSPYAIGAIVCAGITVILVVVFLLMALKTRRREQQLRNSLAAMHDENMDDLEAELLDENNQPNNAELPLEYNRLKQQWEIVRKDIHLVDLIAKGSFVEVWQGRMRKYPRRNDIMKVAVKRIVSEVTDKERRFFLAELEILKAIHPHPNILPLISCYTASDPWLMIVEYAAEGSLYQFLQQRRPGNLRVEINHDDGESVTISSHSLDAHKLLSMAVQVVNGLLHINRYKMIFYRLRSANVLVSKGGVCKLSGFGFAQDIAERNRYESNSAPVRWLSPESLLENVYNVKTDIWSFGILLWEIVHFGHLPYPDMGPNEVVEKIQTGYRMSQPIHCSSEIYNLMLMCWAENAVNRPSFGDVLQNLNNLLKNAEKHINIDKLPQSIHGTDTNGLADGEVLA